MVIFALYTIPISMIDIEYLVYIFRRFKCNTKQFCKTVELKPSKQPRRELHHELAFGGALLAPKSTQQMCALRGSRTLGCASQRSAASHPEAGDARLWDPESDDEPQRGARRRALRQVPARASALRARRGAAPRGAPRLDAAAPDATRARAVWAGPLRA